MAYGGGSWVAQNKVLPGAYINFVSASGAFSALSERGVCAIAVQLDWGPDGRVFELTERDFRTHAFELLGHEPTDDALRDLRELFKGAQTAFLYRLNGEGTKAANAYATALHSGTRGNDIRIIIEVNASDDTLFDVSTHLGTREVDRQTVKNAAVLKDNLYVAFKAGATLEATAGTPLTGGANGDPTNAVHQAFLDAIESHAFNTLGCISDDSLVKALYAAFTRRMREENGRKFQAVVHRYEADYEGVISVENNDTPELVYWVTGMEAGCAVNASLTNTAYDGELIVNTDYTQKQLEQGIQAGKLMLHNAYNQPRVLTDINTLVTYGDGKSKAFSINQTVRVLDQIGNDIARLFNEKYLGQIPNDAGGRVSLWGDIVAHHRELEEMRAIEDFNADLVTVSEGQDPRAVLVEDWVTPINAMEQLYMAVYVA